MTDTVESLGRIRLQGIMLLVLVFLAGGLSGAALMRVSARGPEPHGPPLMEGPPGMTPGRIPPVFDRLGLSDDQRVRIQAAFDGARPKSDSILGAALPAVRAIMDSLREEIRAILTEEQRKQFDEMERNRPPGGPGRGEPPFGPPQAR
jgi:Spy/CpxP family protein refolding chaperone